ncbi:MAG: D-aminoacyl-tRNA deacylase [Sphaerochaetaceae bacterium]|jgi:D-tyrosyl-tRNA(Tyr) deacylase
MKCVIQRVENASVSVEGKIVGSIEKGILVYFGVQKGDTENQMRWLCDKMARLRLFRDDEGKMNLSLGDVNGQILLISQFTLCANLHKGNRPSYDDAEDPDKANQMYSKALSYLAGLGYTVAHGQFGAHMMVTYTNDGPVTFVLER